MNRGILLTMVTGLLGLAAQTAQADRIVHSAGFWQEPAGNDVLQVDHRRHGESGFGFYYRDRDGFYFGYDPWSGRRWYRDLIRQRYYERHYDHHRRHWRHDRRHYRDFYHRHHGHRGHYRHHDRHDDRGRRGNRRHLHH